MDESEIDVTANSALPGIPLGAYARTNPGQYLANFAAGGVTLTANLAMTDGDYEAFFCRAGGGCSIVIRH
jgi:hypothetical protein